MSYLSTRRKIQRRLRRRRSEWHEFYLKATEGDSHKQLTFWRSELPTGWRERSHDFSWFHEDETDDEVL